jgi:L,D-peptidoglycan transpeptidase YkuD (ErfK/YbiS/YcfS/YnhG family)
MLAVPAGSPGRAASHSPSASRRSAPAVMIHDAHGARQIVTVTAGHRDSTRANVRIYVRRGDHWVLRGGPWRAWIGRSGFAAVGKKREGDGKTPSGSFRFSFFFGVASRPAVHFPWRHASSFDYWDDDPASSRYNEWVDSRSHSPGRDPEPLDVSPSYDDVAVIAFNTSRTPGRGSGIFLHVTHHSATSGCVAVAHHDVLRILRWLRPADHPRIVMGTTHSVLG